MEQDRKNWPKSGPTGDPEEDRQRKASVLNRLRLLTKNYELDQNDLFAGFGSATVRPESKAKFEKDRKLVMIALAFGLDDHIPTKMLTKFNLEPGNNPQTNFEDDGKAPF